MSVQLFITRNREYVMRDDVCIGVRDRRTGNWLSGHVAIDQRVQAMVRPRGRKVVAQPFGPHVGSSLYFPRGPVVTSAVRKVRTASSRTHTQLNALPPA